MADYDFENPTFDPDDDYSFDLPDAIMDPLPPRVQQELNTSGDNIQSLRVEITEAELYPLNPSYYRNPDFGEGGNYTRHVQ